MSIIDDLIYDRTQVDVTRWKQLRDKGWHSMTDLEKAEWLTAMKGGYNSSDMNRVESAVQYLSDRLNADGYLFHPVVKTDWAVSDKPLRTDLDRYYGNVDTIRSLLAVWADTPETPTTAKRLDYQMANDLEKILVDVDRLAENMEQVWLYSNDIYCGEV